ncbi:MAG TPA: hypothetical protein VFA19_05395 [Gaiellaceae bacterium]|nr:hypothetical protein [Gaiellaceae bacterium]
MKAWSSLLAVGGCLVAFGAAAWRAPADFRQLDANAASYAHQNALERSLHAAYGEGIDPRFLVAAQRLIPARSTYEVITGAAAPADAPAAAVAITPFAGYWLLPRRQIFPGGSEAPDWVLSYGGDPASLGYRYAKVVKIGPGLSIAKVAR